MLSDNLLLASLSPPVLRQVMALCTPVALPLRTNLYQPGRSLAYAYFITSGIASVVTATEECQSTEVHMVGREGRVGSLQLLGPGLVSTVCFMQAEGTALRIDFSRLQELFLTNDELRARILEFVQEQAITTAQIAGCHRLHSAEQRLALWLLIGSDRIQSDKLSFTQEFLAEMMGTRRTTVTAVATTLQREGLIQYQRGRITLLSRPKLEIAACYCYQVIRALYSNLYHLPFATDGAAQVAQHQQARQRPVRDPNGATSA